MTKNLLHPFHLVTPSPWPLLISMSIFNNLVTMVTWMHKLNYFLSILSILGTLLCMVMWWRDVTREATFMGYHTSLVYNGMRLGMLLFITSEVFFFISFFWAYFHSSLSPTIEIGQLWPPSDINPFNPFDIPLLNTIILITSGLTITWSHHNMLNYNLNKSKFNLLMTLLLGLYFTLIQFTEYLESPFTISDSIYGSTFFMATGFHGLHVIIGSLFLFITMKRMNSLHFSPGHHFGFEAAAWYWHFVDIVWLFLYMSIYWWSFN